MDLMSLLISLKIFNDYKVGFFTGFIGISYLVLICLKSTIGIIILSVVSMLILVIFLIYKRIESKIKFPNEMPDKKATPPHSSHQSYNEKNDPYA